MSFCLQRGCICRAYSEPLVMGLQCRVCGHSKEAHHDPRKVPPPQQQQSKSKRMGKQPGATVAVPPKRLVSLISADSQRSSSSSPSSSDTDLHHDHHISSARDSVDVAWEKLHDSSSSSSVQKKKGIKNPKNDKNGSSSFSTASFLSSSSTARRKDPGNLGEGKSQAKWREAEVLVQLAQIAEDDGRGTDAERFLFHAASIFNELGMSDRAEQLSSRSTRYEAHASNDSNPHLTKTHASKSYHQTTNWDSPRRETITITSGHQTNTITISLGGRDSSRPPLSQSSKQTKPYGSALPQKVSFAADRLPADHHHHHHHHSETLRHKGADMAPRTKPPSLSSSYVSVGSFESKHRPIHDSSSLFRGTQSLNSNSDSPVLKEIAFDEALIAEAHPWAPCCTRAVLDLFRICTRGRPELPRVDFEACLVLLGVGRRDELASIFAAFDRHRNKTWLGDRDFLLGFIAFHPETPFSGPWARVRLEYIFRYYTTGAKLMSFAQFEGFISALNTASYNLEKSIIHSSFSSSSSTQRGKTIKEYASSVPLLKASSFVSGKQSLTFEDFLTLFATVGDATSPGPLTHTFSHTLSPAHKMANTSPAGFRPHVQFGGPKIALAHTSLLLRIDFVTPCLILLEADG